MPPPEWRADGVHTAVSNWVIRAGEDILPTMPLGGDMGHLAIVNPDGEVVVTVWNHHHRSECYDNAMTILHVLQGDQL